MNNNMDNNMNNINNININNSLNLINNTTQQQFNELLNIPEFNEDNKSIIKYELNILYYDGNLKESKENNSNCSFFKMNNKGTFYGCHHLDLFKYICEQIKKNKKEFILICSGRDFETIEKYCKNIDLIKSYCIYCGNLGKYNDLEEKYSKLKRVFNNFKLLKEYLLSLDPMTIDDNIKSSNLINFKDYNNIYIKLHFEIIRKYFVYKILKTKNNKEYLEFIKKKGDYYFTIAKELLYNDENEVIKYFEENSDAKKELIKAFAKCSHNINNYVFNYTLESFYYKYLNKALREGDFNKFQQLSSHISKFIFHLYDFRNKNKYHMNNNHRLYRIMYITPEELNIYFNSINQVICYPSFTSTSLEDNFLLKKNNPDKQLVKLIIEQNNCQTVVSIGKLSENPNEKEYLFLPFSFFKILKVNKGQGNEENPHIIYLSALNSEKPIEEMILDFIINETDNLDPEGLDMLYLTNNDNTIIINPNLFEKKK